MTDAGPYRPLPVTLRQVAAGTNRIEDLAGGVIKFCGFIEFAGAGELITSIDFPVEFTERPAFSHGGELAANSPIQNGRLPTLTAIVKDWKFTTRKNSAGQRQYTGATFFIVATGLPEQQLILHVQLEAPGTRKRVDPVVTAGHPLLGNMWINGVTTDPPPTLTPGSGFGFVYAGAANLNVASLTANLDGVPIAVDPSASPDFNSFIFYNDVTGTIGGPPVTTGTNVLTFRMLAAGAHTLVVACADVNGVTDSRTYHFTSTGGGTT